MERAELIELAQNNGIIVDKRWNTATLLANLRDNGVNVPDDEPAHEKVELREDLKDPMYDMPLDDVEPIAKQAKKSEAFTVICLDNEIHIAPKDVGKYDNGLSIVYRKGDKIHLLNEGLALSLDAAGRVKLV